MRAQISFDLVMEDSMSFVEGTYRLPGRDWQVFIFGRDPAVSSSVFVTFITDFVGFLSFLALATLILL